MKEGSKFARHEPTLNFIYTLFSSIIKVLGIELSVATALSSFAFLENYLMLNLQGNTITINEESKQ